jgi:hypothetical protein
MLDVGDVVLDLREGRQGLRRNGVAKVLLDLHGDLDGVEGVQSVLGKSAILGDA